MIEAPLDDHHCLGPTTEAILAAIAAENPPIVDLAAQFSDTDALAEWFRTLPQRDDKGVPGEGPKVAACRPPQRLQLDNPSPNCFERSARFIGAAELIEPYRVYRLATVVTPNGLHTVPTRDGQPAILDPKADRNAGPFGLDEDARRLRLQRLIGLDETKGVRGDLSRARRAKELGHTTWVDGSRSISRSHATRRHSRTFKISSVATERDAAQTPQLVPGRLQIPMALTRPRIAQTARATKPATQRLTKKP